MTKCWFCGSNMIWGCDFDFEDYGLDGEGVVATLSGATAEFYSNMEEDE